MGVSGVLLLSLPLTCPISAVQRRKQGRPYTGGPIASGQLLAGLADSPDSDAGPLSSDTWTLSTLLTDPQTFISHRGLSLETSLKHHQPPGCLTTIPELLRP